jgi:hypothetical protein
MVYLILSSYSIWLHFASPEISFKKELIKDVTTQEVSRIQETEVRIREKSEKTCHKSLHHDNNALFYRLFLLNSEYCILTPE